MICAPRHATFRRCKSTAEAESMFYESLVFIARSSCQSRCCSCLFGAQRRITVENLGYQVTFWYDDNGANHQQLTRALTSLQRDAHL
ncbi:hypothetical protein VUR80DRAFT_9885 [Thermomyces stellatus]